jgi:hypothetical protein
MYTVHPSGTATTMDIVNYVRLGKFPEA